ncbi:FecCD family ABC transporter permease [Brevibacterium album]|uniref:FecCD family ABC transporter permease n=1 Tax=Brevibacterium album TaxID=417948 RepID=UPI000421DB7D|nr:iron chelate uptake ABC transporter family permease subunit [Brevibacterium album]
MTAPPTAGVRPRRPAVLSTALLAGVLLLGIVSVLSLFIGSAALSPAEVLRALVRADGDLIGRMTVSGLRLPRTLLGIAVGAALGVAGALAQAVTRNPLADPGILGVSAGAGLAVSLAVAFLGLTRVEDYMWFAFAGALGAFALVYAVALRGPDGATPVRLTLVGVALSAVLTGASQSLALLRPQVFDQMRFWGAGTLADRPQGTLEAVLPFIAAGVVLSLLLGRTANAMALGDERARTLGVPVGALRWLITAVIAVLCGAATAAAGPIAFVGLMVPHAVRAVTGPDQRWVLAFSAVLAPALLLLADVLGRLLVRPAELQAGIVTAFLGAPVLILLVRRAERGGL